MKKTLLITLMALTFNTNAVAAKYLYTLDTKGEIAVWSNVPLSESSYGEWTDIGEPLDCSSWTPAPNTVNNGTSFTQNSDCTQKQTRTITYQLYNKSTGQYQNDRIENEEKDNSVNITQPATGTKSTGYYSWVLQNQHVLKILTGVAADFFPNREIMRTYLNGTQYKYNYTSVSCNSSTLQTYHYSGSASGSYSSNPQPGNDTSTVRGYARIKQCLYVSN